MPYYRAGASTISALPTISFKIKTTPKGISTLSLKTFDTKVTQAKLIKQNVLKTKALFIKVIYHAGHYKTIKFFPTQNILAPQSCLPT